MHEPTTVMSVTTDCAKGARKVKPTCIPDYSTSTCSWWRNQAQWFSVYNVRRKLWNSIKCFFTCSASQRWKHTYYTGRWQERGVRESTMWQLLSSIWSQESLMDLLHNLLNLKNKHPPESQEQARQIGYENRGLVSMVFWVEGRSLQLQSLLLMYPVWLLLQ